MHLEYLETELTVLPVGRCEPFGNLQCKIYRVGFSSKSCSHNECWEVRETVGPKWDGATNQDFAYSIAVQISVDDSQAVIEQVF